MSRPRTIPPTAYPASAELAYYQALNTAITAWFQALAADLSEALRLPAAVRLDTQQPLSGLVSATDAAALTTPVCFRLDDDGAAVAARLQHDLTTARTAQARLGQREQIGRVETAIDTARHRWAALDAQLNQSLAATRQQVNRLSERNVTRQIEAAATNRRLAVTLGQPPFGSLQGPLDRAARESTALIKDIGEKAARDVEALVVDAVHRGASPDDITATLQRRLNVTRTRAALIAQNQTARLESELSTLRAEASGAESFEWLHTVSAHPRADHLENVGKVFPLTHRPLPRQEPNCKCSMRFVWPSLVDQIARTKAANEALRRRLAAV